MKQKLPEVFRWLFLLNLLIRIPLAHPDLQSGCRGPGIFNPVTQNNFVLIISNGQGYKP